jgi:hypothetical protein
MSVGGTKARYNCLGVGPLPTRFQLLQHPTAAGSQMATAAAQCQPTPRTKHRSCERMTTTQMAAMRHTGQPEHMWGLFRRDVLSVSTKCRKFLLINMLQLSCQYNRNRDAASPTPPQPAAQVQGCDSAAHSTSSYYRPSASSSTVMRPQCARLDLQVTSTSRHVALPMSVEQLNTHASARTPS